MRGQLSCLARDEKRISRITMHNSCYIIFHNTELTVAVPAVRVTNLWENADFTKSNRLSHDFTHDLVPRYWLIHVYKVVNTRMVVEQDHKTLQYNTKGV